MLVVRCSLLFIRCSLLVTICSLLVTFCSFLVTFCSLLSSFYSLLVTFYSLPVIFCLLLVTFSQILWAIARLLVIRVTLIYLVYEFFIFSFLVLLKEMGTRSETKISSCCFCVSCKSRELGGRESPRYSCVSTVVESS